MYLTKTPNITDKIIITTGEIFRKKDAIQAKRKIIHDVMSFMLDNHISFIDK